MQWLLAIDSMSKLKNHIPLFQILKELKEHQRQIILDHLDQQSCDSLSACIAHVLKNGTKVLSEEQRKHLSKCFKQNKPQMKRILSVLKKPTSRQHAVKKRALARIGGGPMGAVLRAAIPILVQLISGNKN